MSWEEFLAWPIEGKTEWVDGKGIAYVANSIPHVLVVRFLEDLISLFVRAFGLGVVLADNALLRIASRPAGRSPDLFVVGRGDLGGAQRRWFEGPVLLAVEVISADSGERDLVEKRAEYEQAGVREYLVLDEQPDRRGIAYLRLGADGRFRSVDPDAVGRYHSDALPGCWFDPAWLDQDPLPFVEDLLLLIAPDAYEAWLLARLRARRGKADSP
jgi:Uma2 family endonuclease